MKFREIIIILYNLVFNAEDFWQKMNHRSDDVEEDSDFFKNMMIIHAICIFFSTLIYSDGVFFVTPLLKSFFSVLSYFLTFIICRKALSYFSEQYSFLAQKESAIFRILIYTLSFEMLLSSVIAFAPVVFLFLNALLLFSFYIVWTAMQHTLQVEEEKQLHFLFSVAFPLVLLPIFLNKIVVFFIPIIS